MTTRPAPSTMRKFTTRSQASRLWLLGATLVASGMWGNPAQATPYYFDLNGTTAGAGSGTGTWTVGSNWNTDSTGGTGGTFGTVPTSTDTATLVAGAASGSITAGLGGASVSVSGLAVNSASTLNIGSTVGDGTITLGTGGLTAIGAGTGAVLTINSNINLNGNQSWASSEGGNPTGLAMAGNLGGTGNLSFNTGSGRANNFTGAINNAGTLTFTNTNGGKVTISGNVGSNVTGLSYLATNPFVLSGTNTYTGTTSIKSGANANTGTLTVGSNTALPSTTTVLIDGSAGGSFAKLDLGNGTSSFNPTIAALTTNATLGSGRQGASIVTNSDTTAAFAHTGVLTVQPTSPDNFAGLIQDGASSRVGLTVSGTSTLTLSGANTYTGGTTVSSGALAVTSNSGSSTTLTVGTVTSGNVTQTATVTSSAGLVVGQTVAASGILPGGTTILGISGTTLYLSGHATTTGSTTGTFGAYQTLGSGAVTVSGTGTLDLGSSTATSVGAVTLSGGTIQNGTLTGTSYSATGGTISANGVLAGMAALTKTGAGTTTLAGANTYSGGTTISAGKLLVTNTSGSATGSGTLTLGSSGTLAGKGLIAASSFALNGTVITGTGTDAISSTQVTGASASTIGSTANLSFNLDSANTNSSTLNVVGTGVTFGAGTTLTLNLLGASSAMGNAYVLIAGNATGGGVNGSQHSGFTVSGIDNRITGLNLVFADSLAASTYAGSYLYLNQSGGFDNIEVKVVPEPGTWALMLSGLAMLLVWQRRRSKV